jgi:starvation-inducible DNA-binding protein
MPSYPFLRPLAFAFVALLPALAAAQPSPQAGAAARPAPRAFQSLGAFPENSRTDRPAVMPDQGDAGFQASVGALQRTLTELQALQLQTKQAHWNVSGALFYPLHKLLQEHYEAISSFADDVAERLLAIGASADGRARTIVERSALGEFPGGFVDDAQVIAWFTVGYRQVALAVRVSIRASEEPDPTTSNLLQEVEHGLAKFQWQMRAHLQPTPTDPNTGAEINAGRPIEPTGGTAR